MVSVKHNLIQKQEKKTFNMTLQEIYLLRNIRNLLPSELIYLIYSYMSGLPKLLFNVKYNYLELNLNNDCHNNYKVWNSLKNIINAFSKNQLINFVFNSNIISNEYICTKIWYFSKHTNKFYDRIHLLNLWSGKETNESFDKEDLNSVDYMVKTRIIDAIYNYLLRTIQIYKGQKNLYLKFDCKKIKMVEKKLFKHIDQAFYIYKSFEYINIKLN